MVNSFDTINRNLGAIDGTGQLHFVFVGKGAEPPRRINGSGYRDRTGIEDPSSGTALIDFTADIEG